MHARLVPCCAAHVAARAQAQAAPPPPPRRRPRGEALDVDAPPTAEGELGAFGAMLDAAFEEATAAADDGDGDAQSAPPLALPTLKRLSAQLASLRASRLLRRAPAEGLARLLPLLDACVDAGAGADLGPDAPGAGCDAAVAARALAAAEAAAASMHVLCGGGTALAPDAANEERVGRLLDTVRWQLTRSVLTWHDAQRRLVHASAAKAGPPGGASRREGEGGEDAEMAEAEEEVAGAAAVEGEAVTPRAAAAASKRAGRAARAGSAAASSDASDGEGEDEDGSDGDAELFTPASGRGRGGRGRMPA